MSDLTTKIDRLPPEARHEVEHFVEHLLAKYGEQPRGEMKLDWAGALKSLQSEYSSVELQHEARSLWGRFD